MTAPIVEPRHLSGDDATLDRLVNDEGFDQITASQLLWAPHLLDATEPPLDAPRAEQIRWARFRGRQIVRQGMASVLRWLGMESDYLALYRTGKTEVPRG